MSTNLVHLMPHYLGYLRFLCGRLMKTAARCGIVLVALSNSFGGSCNCQSAEITGNVRSGIRDDETPPESSSAGVAARPEPRPPGTEDPSNVARIQLAVEQYTEAMECTDRAQRLSLFSRAEQLFRQIIDGDGDHPPISNPDLYVNLGNAALQAERFGPAIVAYRRALAMDPQDSRAHQNLSHVRSLLPKWVRYDDTHNLIDSLFFWQSLLPVAHIQVCGGICFLFAAGLVAWGVLRQQNLLRNLAVVPLIAWAVILASLFLHPDEATRFNAVVVHESLVYTADSRNSPPRLFKPLPSGAELKLIRQRDRWSELELPDGRTGWVLSAGIDTISNAARAF